MVTKSIERVVVELLAGMRCTLSVAENMSGGNLAARLTSIPPGCASRVFLGGVTVYSALAKAVLAGLDPALFLLAAQFLSRLLVNWLWRCVIAFVLTGVWQ